MSQQKTQPRYWTIQLRTDEDGYPDWDDLEARLRAEGVRLMDIAFRLGGKCYVEPIREQDEHGLWHTTGANFVWDSFVPGRRKPQAAAAAPEPPEEGADIVPLPVEDEPVAA